MQTRGTYRAALPERKLGQVLHSRQHGFRQGLSCESADRGDTIYAVVLDFAKGFDNVQSNQTPNAKTKVIQDNNNNSTNY